MPSAASPRSPCATSAGAARANVAAVNYHFHGKTGLYEEVLRSAIQTMRGTTEAAQRAGAGRPPAEQLEAFIAIFLQKVVEGRNSWIHQLMMHELSDPTPALDLVVDEVLRPRMAYLSGIIASLIGLREDDPRVARCLMSVQAQIHALLVQESDRRPSRAGAAVDRRRRGDDRAAHHALLARRHPRWPPDGPDRGASPDLDTRLSCPASAGLKSPPEVRRGGHSSGWLARRSLATQKLVSEMLSACGSTAASSGLKTSPATRPALSKTVRWTMVCFSNGENQLDGLTVLHRAFPPLGDVLERAELRDQACQPASACASGSSFDRRSSNSLTMSAVLPSWRFLRMASALAIAASLASWA